MKRYLFGVLSLAALLAVAPVAPVHAEDTGAPIMTSGDGPGMGGGMGRHHMRDMTPEQREQMRAKMKEKFDSLPPEKQAEIRAKMEERRAKMKDASPEERKAMMEKWRSEHGHRGGGAVTHGQPAPAPTDVE